MTLRFFADHCVPGSIVQGLRDAGHVVVRLGECLPVESPDVAVIAKAQALGCILISLNGDFADIVAYPPAAFKGIVSIQLRNHPEITPQVVVNLKSYLAAHPDMGDYRGKLLLVEVHRIRIRH